MHRSASRRACRVHGRGQDLLRVAATPAVERDPFADAEVISKTTHEVVPPTVVRAGFHGTETLWRRGVGVARTPRSSTRMRGLARRDPDTLSGSLRADLWKSGGGGLTTPILRRHAPLRHRSSSCAACGVDSLTDAGPDTMSRYPRLHCPTVLTPAEVSNAPVARPYACKLRWASPGAYSLGKAGSIETR